MRKLVFTLMVFLAFCGYSFAQNTIEAELQQVLDRNSDGMVSINIILKSQMDINDLQSRVRGINDKNVRRSVLIDELKLFAEREQRDILSILRAEEKGSRVAEIESRWIANYINCKASNDVIYLLAKHPDVMMIGYNEEKNLLWNEKAETVDNSRSGMTENITMVNADDAWELGYTGYGVVVAVIDTGVNYEHVDLADHLWDGGDEFPNHGYDLYYNDNDPMDMFGHGTHCAGTVSGDGTSGTKTGIAPESRIMCVKAIGDEGSGTADHIVSGMEWAIDHGADILSMSLGVQSSTTTERTMLRNTSVNALQLGVVAAVAVGNEGNMMWMYPIPNNVRVPGGCPPPWLHPDQADVNPGELSCVVAVGAVDYSDNATDFTSHGPFTWQGTSFNDYAYNPGIGLIRPDICAPGKDIVSLDYATNNGHTSMSGTSMATPCVAGIMALMMEKKPDLTPAEICEILETTGVKLTENKNNVTGSARVDALAALESIESGDFKYVSHSINDDENGNANGNINPMEQAKLNVTMENASSQSYNNVTAVLRTNNILVRVDDSIAQVGSIGANETISIVDEFEFTVDITAEFKSILAFDVCLYDENNELISFVRVPVSVYGSEIEYSTVIIKNDNNNNGVLEPGETADFGVVINNVGNEVSFNIVGELSSNSNKITINESEAYFNAVGGESSTVAYFNVTLDANAGDSFSIPFTLTTKSDINQETINELSFSYSNKCNVIFVLYDSYGDGWDGAAIYIKYSDGTPDDALTLTSGTSQTFTREVGNGVEVTLEWMKGSWDLECSFVVMKENGTEIYSNGGFLDNGFLYSWVNDCSMENQNYEMCDGANNLEYIFEGNSPKLTWEAPESGDVLHYEIYRDAKFMGTTEELTYTDMSDATSQSYTYSVRPVYEGCYGLFTSVTVNFDDVEEFGRNINASVYPNPSNGKFTIECNDMTRVVVFNVMGAMVSDYDVNCNRFIIDELEAGVYFVRIETKTGNTVCKIVSL